MAKLTTTRADLLNLPYLSIDEAAELLGLNHKTIRRKIDSGELKAGKIGRRWRIRREDLLDLAAPKNTKKEEDPSTKIMVRLSPEVLRELRLRALTDGTSAEEVLAGFARDLTWTDEHGSDEADLANEYYQRVGYRLMAPPMSFSRYVLTYYGIDGLKAIRHACDLLETLREDLEAEADPEARKDIREDITYTEADLRERYEEYQREAEEPVPIREALEDAKKTLEELKA